MSYKVGDKVVFKGIIEGKGNNYQIRLKDTILWLSENEINEMPSKTYEDGLIDGWKLAGKLGSYEGEKRVKIFNHSDAYHFGWILNHYSPQEALANIEAYEKSQQIQVGDVVKVRTGAGSEHIGVVTQITANQNCACIVYADGSTEMNTANNMTKTNKHLDIEHLLEQIRGDE